MRNAVIERARCWCSFSNLAVWLPFLSGSGNIRGSRKLLPVWVRNHPPNSYRGTQDFPALIVSQPVAAAFPQPMPDFVTAYEYFPLQHRLPKHCTGPASTVSCQGELPASCSMDLNKASRCDSGSWRSYSTASWRGQYGELPPLEEKCAP